MARTAYIAEIDPREVAALAYVAGMLQGQGVPQGQLIAGILDRIQLVEVPDDFGELDDDVEDTAEGEGEKADGSVVELFPQPVSDTGEELDTTLPAIDPLLDPTSPESLGIQLNLPAPPPPPGPQSPQDTFGAGPPPKE